MKKILIKLSAILCLLLPSCKTQYIPIPAETSTTVTVKDSIRWNVIDSTRIIEKSRYKDYGSLLDTLRTDGQRSHSKSWIDTTFNILNTELVEDPIIEKTRIEFRDRIEYRDSISYVEKPVPYEVDKPVPYVPKFYRIFSIIGVILTAVLGVLGYLKLRGSGLFSKIVKLFSKNHMV